MPLRPPAGFIRPGYNPLLVPNAPTIGAATGISGGVSVAFTAPSNVGGSAITSYTVIASNGSFASGSSSPISVTGLTNGVSYTFYVFASNSYGPSAASGTVSQTAGVPTGEQLYTAAGTYSWIAPTGVTSVSVVCVGCGGNGEGTGAKDLPGFGGGGGGLGYKNDYPVTPGSSYTVVLSTSVGAASYFVSTAVVQGANVTSTGRLGGGFTGDGGGNGGNGGTAPGGGGGAGGYAGAGGNGGSGGGGTNGAGGGGGGGGGTSPSQGYGGGGVGIYGQGASGAGQASQSPGGGGSGGETGTRNGGAYGGGGGGRAGTSGGTRAQGAVRIVWPGATRQFPSTNVGPT